MNDLHITFQNSLKHFGPPTNDIPISNETLLAYEGKLPAARLDLWRQYGLGMWMKGYFQFCDPSVYGGLLEIFWKTIAISNHLVVT